MKILIVDDDENIRFIFSKVLQGYCIKTAINGLEAVETSISWNPDLILMDIRMPIMDGIEAAIKIKNINENQKIIGISAYSEIESEHLENNPFTSFLRKPISINQLREEVEKYLQHNKFL
ncbi:MAG: response regulator [Candidatus Heimdallarchaeum aukensis]|uniref:Response regulator n=1 Tax=Candidatus Heimdallarchaeum aukensis TaxID=2876573 RepID=A0A9Y1BKJ9_9ARCH|nr:MAG: response regulator [Candidatus Heimdallarchaeum aukensis]